LYDRVEIPVDPAPYEVVQVWYPSKDNTPISMFLVHKKGLVKDGRHPVLLRGYGGFNVSITPTFSSRDMVWLERGGVLAEPNLRGGGEYGEPWHQAGMLEHKQNTFDDFISAAEWLIAERYTAPDRLAIEGGSNGGLLVGAVMTQRPELFGAVVCSVPLLDMIRYHRFGSGKTWTAEYGDPDVEADFRVLYAYSPYHHVREGVAYPPLLVLSADSDDRVDPLHARKFVAAIQESATTPGPYLLRVQAKAGHGGADRRQSYVEEAADVIAFLAMTIAR
jgi:prolyl oligopeptidase